MENLSEKDLRNKRIIDMHNGGSTIEQISKAVGMSKGGVHKVLGGVLISNEIPNKKTIVPIKLTGNEQIVSSFVGWTRTDVYQYAHKDTGEIMNVVYVKAKSVNEYGYFVIVG
jgi:hypothetical protein